MFKINNGTIHCSRGDAGTITLRIPNKSGGYYTFATGDVIKFQVYNKNGYDAIPLVTKIITVSSPSDSVAIPLNEDDTTFGEIPNRATTYWYDITLNDDQTVVCYNEDGAREFIQYPAKGDEE